MEWIVPALRQGSQARIWSNFIARIKGVMWQIGWRLWDINGNLSQIHIHLFESKPRLSFSFSTGSTGFKIQLISLVSGHHSLLRKIGDYSDLEVWDSIYKCLPLVSASTFYLKLCLAERQVICGEPEEPTAREASIPNDLFFWPRRICIQIGRKEAAGFLNVLYVIRWESEGVRRVLRLLSQGLSTVLFPRESLQALCSDEF